ncbi:hypothetical protein J4Q44_G00284940 [Coregonus suidteri]|uniref:Uncharacterized protein n=1 Tax=Coregonus suidteri TaxID=861788 RepID=A0AAN8QIU5_9TELE
MEKRNRDLIDLIAPFQHLHLCGGEEEMDWIDQEMGVTCCQEEERNEKMDWISSSNPNFSVWRENEDDEA